MLDISPWYSPEIHGEFPTPRAAHSCDKIGDKLFFFGGWNGLEALDDLQMLYMVPKFKWQKLTSSDNRPSPRNNHASASYGNILIIHGGHNGEIWLDDMFQFEILKSDFYEYIEVNECLIGEWKKLAPCRNTSNPPARACHTLSRVFNKLYLFGGYNGSHCFNDLWMFDLVTKRWSEIILEGKIPFGRNGHCTVSNSRNIIFFGGHSGKSSVNEVLCFNLSTNTFSKPKMYGVCPPARKGHTTNIIDDNTIVVFGGYSRGIRSNCLYILDITNLPESVRWEQRIENQAPSPRQRHSTTTIGPGKIFLFGGYDGKNWLADAYILDTSKFLDSFHNRKISLPMLGNLGCLVDNPDFSDVVFILKNGETLYAHKCILIAQSSYFKAMFKVGMRESSSETIYLHHICKREFYAIIKFLYTSYLDEIDVEILCNIMHLADIYDIKSLSEICERKIRNYTDISNVCKLVDIANRYNANTIVDYCIEFAANHASIVIRSRDFQYLTSTNPHLAMKISNSAINNLL
ncbi:kelch motif family protein [Cryptosporidium muris RN66]|uniref:Kelch motif family protein n=1 Tax=Cryptosporidium muris (strain RN66) TaxID=441375 RepID=B6ACN6_CRYMR|nr:kelch motif family protein [Cryptosporidium muris RN66]EEA05890.1 kelch motif family protein [Cryptosporidium muris RN66]|eukprot:XP_002140239.1 kelch motif family protein [Cryptosporidium muris RN66]